MILSNNKDRNRISFHFFSSPNIEHAQTTMIVIIFLKPLCIFTCYLMVKSLILKRMILKLLCNNGKPNIYPDQILVPKITFVNSLIHFDLLCIFSSCDLRDLAPSVVMHGQAQIQACSSSFKLIFCQIKLSHVE